jgi:hypothetical protein
MKPPENGEQCGHPLKTEIQRSRLVERSAEPMKVNWADSPALTRDRSGARMLTREEALNLIHEASGKW